MRTAQIQSSTPVRATFSFGSHLTTTNTSPAEASSNLRRLVLHYLHRPLIISERDKRPSLSKNRAQILQSSATPPATFSFFGTVSSADKTTTIIKLQAELFHILSHYFVKQIQYLNFVSRCLRLEIPTAVTTRKRSDRLTAILTRIANHRPTGLRKLPITLTMTMIASPTFQSLLEWIPM